jgi:hypothetical protein
MGPRVISVPCDANIFPAAPSGLCRIDGGWAVVKRGATVARFTGSGSKVAAIRANGGRNQVIA